MKPLHLIILVALNVVWAATLSIYKALELYLQPGDLVTMRFGIAAVSLLLLWAWLPGDAPRGRDLIKTCILGLIVFVLGHRLQVFGNHLSTASNSSILTATEPLITSMAAAVFLREHIGPRRVLGFALGMAGVALLNGVWRPDFKWVSLGASTIFVSSYVCEAAFSIGGKPIVTSASPIKFSALALAAGAAANLLLDGRQTLSAVTHLPGHAWLLLLLIGVIGTAFGYGFWFIVIRDCEVNVAALTIFLQPVSGVLIARLWLGESLHWGHLWGSLAIVLGLVVGLSRQVKSPAAVETMQR
jgi:drug/metabolite transporter (DMT)-like permease